MFGRVKDPVKATSVRDKCKINILFFLCFAFFGCSIKIFRNFGRVISWSGCMNGRTATLVLPWARKVNICTNFRISPVLSPSSGGLRVWSVCSLAEAPDRTFRILMALKSVDWRFWTTQNLSFQWLLRPFISVYVWSDISHNWTCGVLRSRSSDRLKELPREKLFGLFFSTARILKRSLQKKMWLSWGS